MCVQIKYLVVDVLFPGGNFLKSFADLLMQFVEVDLGVRECGINAILMSVHLFIVSPPVLSENAVECVELMVYVGSILVT